MGLDELDIAIGESIGSTVREERIHEVFNEDAQVPIGTVWGIIADDKSVVDF
jgi:hypothetical protein